MSDDQKTELVVEPNKLEKVLPLLGYELDKEGRIVDMEDGSVVESPDGEVLTIDEIGYIGSTEDGGVEPVKDDISSIVDYLSDREK